MPRPIFLCAMSEDFTVSILANDINRDCTGQYHFRNKTSKSDQKEKDEADSRLAPKFHPATTRPRLGVVPSLRGETYRTWPINNNAWSQVREPREQATGVSNNQARVREIGGRVRQIQGKRQLVQVIGRFEKPRVREIGFVQNRQKNWLRMGGAGRAIKCDSEAGLKQSNPAPNFLSSEWLMAVQPRWQFNAARKCRQIVQNKRDWSSTMAPCIKESCLEQLNASLAKSVRLSSVVSPKLASERRRKLWIVRHYISCVLTHWSRYVHRNDTRHVWIVISEQKSSFVIKNEDVFSRS